MQILNLILIVFLSYSNFSHCQDSSQPNIIFILADDLGWNDIGFHNEEVISPNINKLASEGIIFERNYAQPVCTPSRSALMTGIYPFKIGRSGLFPINSREPVGLTLNHTLLPELMKSAGYATHMVGKWHLGNCKLDYLPNQRGFDSFLGYWSGGETYYTKSAADPQVSSDIYDFHLNNEVFLDRSTYSLDLYLNQIRTVLTSHSKEHPLFLYVALQNVHTPYEVPEVYEEMYPNAEPANRKKLLGMVTAMDDAVGNITESLKVNELYDNSIIIFVSDNGGQAAGRINVASNYPLRADKGTFYEGGVRTPAFIHAPSLISEKAGTLNEKLIHMTDWMPTILNLAQASGSVPNDIDGFDQTEAIFGDEPSPRKMVVNEFGTNLRRPTTHQGAIQIEDGWKLLMNPVEHKGPPKINENREDDEDVYELYNIHTDPSESINLIEDYPELFQTMKAQMLELVNDFVKEDKPDDGLDIDITDGEGNLATGWC